MPAYLIARVNVTDWEKYKEYVAATPAAIARYQGRFIVRGGDVTALEGPEESNRIVVIEFPSVDKAVEFYNSQEYSEAKKLREGAANGQFIVVDGC